MKHLTSLSAKQCALRPCLVCAALNTKNQHKCWQCQSHLVNSSAYAIQRTLALLITAVLLFIPANFLPMMTTTYLGNTSNSTILGGVILLWQHKSYFVAIVIFFASIVIPVGKLMALSWLCYLVMFQPVKVRKTEYKLLRLIEFIGRWSMVDVFVVAILVALIQMGALMSIKPGLAAIAFAGLVLTTMLAVMSFQPKLLWQTVTSK
jgi:paraquat-inducible protein A